MNEEQLQQLGQQLADIELPPEPNWWPLIWIVLGFLLIQTLFTVIMFKKRRSAANKTLPDDAQQRLQQIQQQWQHDELNSRDAAYQLATALRLGLGLKQLKQTPPEFLSDQKTQWQNVIKQLQQLRYENHCDASLDDDIFSAIQRWLKQSTQTC